MSGLDKAVNKFREFDSIVFLGKFRVPNYVIGEFNRDYRVETTCDKFSLYQLIQAITRTRIRNHRWESVNVYFSDDWDNGIIDMVKNYLSNRNVGSISTKYSYNETLSFIKPKWRSDIETLMIFDEGFKDSILRRNGYVLDISLDDIYSIIPRGSKEVRKYYPLAKYLKGLGIDLILSTNSNRPSRFSF